jgi:hypothetical protein
MLKTPYSFLFPIIHIDVSTAPTVEKDDTCLWVASGVCWNKIPPPPVWGKVSTKSAMGHLQIVVAAACRPKVVIRKNKKEKEKYKVVIRKKVGKELEVGL